MALLARWEPFDELASMHNMMDRLFGRAFPAGDGGSTAYLATDIEETDSGYRITAPVPGFKPEEVDVTFENGLLRISAQHAEQEEPQSRHFVRRELVRGTTERTIQLGAEVAADNIRALVEHGMLTVEVPRVKVASGFHHLGCAGLAEVAHGEAAPAQPAGHGEGGFELL